MLVYLTSEEKKKNVMSIEYREYPRLNDPGINY